MLARTLALLALFTGCAVDFESPVAGLAGFEWRVTVECGDGAAEPMVIDRPTQAGAWTCGPPELDGNDVAEQVRVLCHRDACSAEVVGQCGDTIPENLSVMELDGCRIELSCVERGAT